MKIAIASLSEGAHSFHLTAEPAALALGESFTDQVAVHLTIEKTPREVFLSAVITTSGMFLCDRCLEPFERTIRTSYRMIYLQDSRDASRYPPEEVFLLDVGKTVVDITDDVRQFILLAVPLKLLCSEDCKGLCQYCGRNRNRETCTCAVESVHPRWDVLKNLTKN